MLARINLRIQNWWLQQGFLYYIGICFNLQIVKNLNTVISTVLVKMFSCFHNAEMHPEDAYGVASKSLLLQDQPDLSWHSLLRPVCLNT